MSQSFAQMQVGIRACRLPTQPPQLCDEQPGSPECVIWPHVPDNGLIFLASLGIRAQHFPEGTRFPLPKPGLARSPSVQEGQLLRHP